MNSSLKIAFLYYVKLKSIKNVLCSANYLDFVSIFNGFGDRKYRAAKRSNIILYFGPRENFHSRRIKDFRLTLRTLCVHIIKLT